MQWLLLAAASILAFPIGVGLMVHAVYRGDEVMLASTFEAQFTEEVEPNTVHADAVTKRRGTEAKYKSQSHNPYVSTPPRNPTDYFDYWKGKELSKGENK